MLFLLCVFWQQYQSNMCLIFDDVFDAQVGLLCDSVSNRLDGRPYALLGHSLGAIIAYEVAREMVRRNYPAPFHVCISSVLPPSHANFQRAEIMSRLSDADFLVQAEERCWLREMKDRAGKLGHKGGNR